MLLCDSVFVLKVLEPTAVLLPAATLTNPDSKPIKVLLVLVVHAAPASYPTAVLLESVAEVKFCVINAP